MNRLSIVALGALLMPLGGCKEQPASAAAEPAAPQRVKAEVPPAAAPVDDKAAAEEIFATRCTPCHGPKGAGDGAASASLTPKPRNFTDPDWQAKVTDEHIEKIIVYGGAAVGRSPAMPANPDLDPKPGLVKALRAHIRALKP